MRVGARELILARYTTLLAGLHIFRLSRPFKHYFLYEVQGHSRLQNYHANPTNDLKASLSEESDSAERLYTLSYITGITKSPLPLSFLFHSKAQLPLSPTSHLQDNSHAVFSADDFQTGKNMNHGKDRLRIFLKGRLNGFTRKALGEWKGVWARAHPVPRGAWWEQARDFVRPNWKDDLAMKIKKETLSLQKQQKPASCKANGLPTSQKLNKKRPRFVRNAV